jgi:hypothetical protein
MPLPKLSLLLLCQAAILNRRNLLKNHEILVPMEVVYNLLGRTSMLGTKKAVNKDPIYAVS